MSSLQEYEITPAGSDLIDVALSFEQWLAKAPGGPIALGSNDAANALRLLTGGQKVPGSRTLGVVQELGPAGFQILRYLDDVKGRASVAEIAQAAQLDPGDAEARLVRMEELDAVKQAA